MKISINLLPPEFRAEELKRAKFYKIQAIGVVIVLMMTFLTSTTVALRILQSHNIQQIQTRFSKAEQKVLGLKNTQASLMLLQNRLTTINQYLGVSSKQTSMYQLIDKLIPQSVSVNAITVDKSGQAVFTALVSDSQALDNLMTNLTSLETNENKISQVQVESINRGRDGIYRISFKVNPR